jgi:hypothetical protein
MHVTDDITHFCSHLESIGCLSDVRTIDLSSIYLNGASLPTRGILTNSGLSREQSEYICSLKPRSEMKAIKGSFYQITFINSGADSKDIFISPDFRLIYDAKPHWLTDYIAALKSLGLEQYPIDTILEGFCVPGGLLSYSHFIGRNLAPFIVFGSYIDLPFALLVKQRWQEVLVSKYSSTARIVKPSEVRCLRTNILMARFSSSWLFEELMDWEGLLLARSQLGKISKNLNDSRHPAEKEEQRSPYIYISRLRYEILNNRETRNINWSEILFTLTSLKFNVIFPEVMEIDRVISLVYNSRLIVCDSGSAFMNYVIFASSTTRIIQLSPNDALIPGRDFNLLSPIQWYLPVANQTIFFSSERKPAGRANNHNKWNMPATYNVNELSELVNTLQR